MGLREMGLTVGVSRLSQPTATRIEGRSTRAPPVSASWLAKQKGDKGGLFAAASDFGVGESGGGAAALVLEVSDDALMNNGASDVGWGVLEVNVGLADFIVGEGEDWDGGELRGD
ncbi:hypothetical protein CMV_005492 [Castanea mollissima]|uniref:Uncharacterized protein n=1 Tax=Castanea mollissima TaxID=60419 RepID=A0A8J4VSC0_9ROSI|nr:hypothetical protein CMV_005492 [Castanea mollissima]